MIIANPKRTFVFAKQNLTGKSTILGKRDVIYKAFYEKIITESQGWEKMRHKTMGSFEKCWVKDQTRILRKKSQKKVIACLASKKDLKDKRRFKIESYGFYNSFDESLDVASGAGTHNHMYLS